MLHRFLICGLAAIAVSTAAFSHGDVAPQPVDTEGLPKTGDEWLEENPYRAEAAGEEVWAKAIQIGASGYNQNCARCHGLEVISGGLAPDLRYLEANFDGDEWYVERFRYGKTQNGITKMPAFGELLGQEAAWAIRTYVETRPDDGALDEYSDTLKNIRDDLAEKSDALKDGAKYDTFAGQIDAHRETLVEVASKIETASGAPVAESAVSRAIAALDGSANGVRLARENLSVGLSAAQ